MEYDIQYARLATNEKLSDRFLNTQVKRSTDLSKSEMGQVYSLVEILTPWLPTARIGQTIINTFCDSYYQGGSTSDLANFENALKITNETLAAITQNGETDWIGNLNAILGVIVENKMHLAQTGKAEAYIFRDGKVDHLTYGLAQNGSEPHPLKTFSNITSGELKDRDIIMIANPEIYQYLNMESLRQIITLNSPNEAVLQIAKLLKKKKVSTVNLLIINLLKLESLAKQPVETDETIYLDRPLESFWAGAGRLWQQIVFPILKFLGKSSKKAGEKTVSFTKNYLATLQAKKAQNEPMKKKDLFDKEFLDPQREETLLKDEEISYSPELEVHIYNQNQISKGNKFLGILDVIWKQIKRFIFLLARTYQNRKTRPYFFIGLAIFILIIIGFIISSKRHNGTSNVNLNQAQAILKSAEDLSKQGKQQVLQNDKENAKQSFSEAITKLKEIENYPIVSVSAKQVLADSYTEMDKLTNTTRYTQLDPILTLDKDAKKFFIVGGYAYIVTNEDIYRALISGGKPQKVASIPKNSGDFSAGTAINNNIYLYTSSQRVYEYQTQTEKLDLVKVSGNWETANDITNFSNNIYLLDGIIGQIYKHSSDTNGFGAGETYVSSPSIDIKNSASITIDGNVYVLRSNGEVLKLKSGKLQDFELKNIPSPYSKIDKPLKIYTDGDITSLYILDGGQKRILEFDKEGTYIRQYALPDSVEYNDFIVSVKAKKIWLLNHNNVYEIGL